MAISGPESNVMGSVLNTVVALSPTTQTTTGNTRQQLELSPEGYNKIIRDILASDSGLASLAIGENISGGYGSTVKAQLAQDMVLNAAGELAKLTAPMVSQSQQRTKKKTSVICTELHRQGYLPTELYDAGYEHFSKLPARTVAGYRVWANKVVPLMQRSKLLTKLLAPIALARYNYVVHGKFSILGAATIYVGQPICYAISLILSEEKVNGYLSTASI